MTDSPNANNERITVGVRLPSEMHKRIKVLAEKEHRSVTQQVAFVLEQYIAQQRAA